MKYFKKYFFGWELIYFFWELDLIKYFKNISFFLELNLMKYFKTFFMGELSRAARNWCFMGQKFKILDDF